ncbi:MAG: hypothetical protein CK551_02855 [Planctomycetaceae bacterium]|nr:DUF2341 domain-containing protein [Gemmataceae bacterium]PHX64053.1 MAG: hypothetical protein CK551_02855 [Planctomycetaceae bacterium]
MKSRLILLLLSCLIISPNAFAQYPAWQQSGSLYILTTPEGANLPESAKLSDFPLLVRLHKDFFNFTKAKSMGEDLRFSSAEGKPLKFQIEQWDGANGFASIWVRVPLIQGNQRQRINLHWGNPNCESESDGKAVFNESNGYAAVMHMSEKMEDSTGFLTVKDQGTSDALGMIGRGRHLAGKQGLFLGENISSFPVGANGSSTEAWFRAEKPNSTVVAWGKEQRPGKVMMNVLSPPRVAIQCYFADVDAKSGIAMERWVHVAHTYEKGDSRVYIDGVLDGNTKPILDIPTPARMWIGGWYNNYNFVGDVDEVRISKVARSADWIKLQYENQKPMQTVTGLLVEKGDTFSVSKKALTIKEGKSEVVAAEVKGAQKLYWILKRDGIDAVVAVDRLGFNFEAPRVTQDTKQMLRLKAIFPNEIKTIDIPIIITEDIPEPLFTLKAPLQWDGRETIEVVPTISNQSEMTAKGVGKASFLWTVSGLAVIKEVAGDKLILKRGQNSGKMTVILAINNGGAQTTKSITVEVTEPKKDTWVQRVSSKEERPMDNQFYGRDDKNEGTLFCSGTLSEPSSELVLKVFADEKVFKTETQKPGAGGIYAFTVKLKPGLIKYRIELITKKDGKEVVVHKADNLICGDAYLIQGQSNAVATDIGKEDPEFSSEWIRSFGSTSTSPDGSRLKYWGNAIHRGRKNENAQIGYWGMELGRRLVEAHKVPVCFINGAVGGTRIDMHQRNPLSPEDASTIYGRLLWRVKEAGLTHAIKAVIWHQGENDQGADGPTGGYGWETYLQYFVDLSASWKSDFPNIQNYYLFQIWPKSCSMGVAGSDNMLREIQRTLPRYFSNMGVMSTLGINPPGGCHFPPAGYSEFARMICPLVERDLYGRNSLVSITPPNLENVSYSNSEKTEITLKFDQAVVWSDSLVSEFYLDGVSGNIASGSVSNNVLTLKLKNASQAKKIMYLDSKAWNGKNLLLGANGIAALTFCDVPVLSKP